MRSQPARPSGGGGSSPRGKRRALAAGGLILPAFLVLGGFGDKASAETAAPVDATAGATSTAAKAKRLAGAAEKPTTKAQVKAPSTPGSTMVRGSTARSSTTLSSSKGATKTDKAVEKKASPLASTGRARSSSAALGVKKSTASTVPTKRDPEAMARTTTATKAPRSATKLPVSTPTEPTVSKATEPTVAEAHGARLAATDVEAAAAVDRLGTADAFAVLAGTPQITNTGPTSIQGDVGLHPGTRLTGFAPCTAPAPADCVTLTGATHVADGVALQAQNDLVTAYNGLVALEMSCTPVDVALAMDVYTPGVYCSPGTFNLAAAGILTLDAQGNPDAEFIFLTGAGGSTLITGAGSQVLLTGGAQACNVYWQVASSATIGVNTTFVGNILALTSIQLQTGATLQGSALARNAAVTLDTNTITQGLCGRVVTPPGGGGGGTTPPGGGGGRSTPPGSGGGTPTRAGTPVSVTTDLRTTGLTRTGLTTTGLTSKQPGPPSGSFAVTGSSVQSELLLAGMAIALGSLMVRLSKPRPSARRGSAVAR